MTMIQQLLTQVRTNHFGIYTKVICQNISNNIFKSASENGRQLETLDHQGDSISTCKDINVS